MWIQNIGLKVKSNITKYYIVQFFTGFYFIFPIQAIFLLSKGITLEQLALAASITLLTLTLFEIPTGFVADKYSRKLSTSLGLTCQSLAYIAMAYVTNFNSYIPVAFLLGLGAAFLSGSLGSLIYDELISQNSEADLVKISSKAHIFGISSSVFATFIGPILFGIQSQIPFILTGLFLLLMAGYVLTFSEGKKSHEVEKEIKILDGVKKVFLIKPILIITLIEILLLVFVFIFYEVMYNQKINNLGLPIKYLGVLDSANLLLSIGMLAILPRIQIKNDKLSLIIYTIATGVLFVIFCNTNNLIRAVLFGVAFDIVWAARNHVIPVITNKYFESHDRALSTSSMSFVSGLGAAILIPVAMSIFVKNYWYTLIPLGLILVLLYLYPKESSL